MIDDLAGKANGLLVTLRVRPAVLVCESGVADFIASVLPLFPAPP